MKTRVRTLMEITSLNGMVALVVKLYWPQTSWLMAVFFLTMYVLFIIALNFDRN